MISRILGIILTLARLGTLCDGHFWSLRSSDALDLTLPNEDSLSYHSLL
jgi:hypothetical protein